VQVVYQMKLPSVKGFFVGKLTEVILALAGNSLSKLKPMLHNHVLVKPFHYNKHGNNIIPPPQV